MIRRHRARTCQRLALLVLAAVVFLPGCGKKGPPLPPLVKAPARPDPLVARRLGSTVYIQFRIPTINTDNTSPANIEKVEVYGFTGVPVDNEDIFKNGMLVASVPVRKPIEDGSADLSKRQQRDAKARQDEKARKDAQAKKDGKAADAPAKPAAPPRPPGSMENGFDQGDTVTVTEPIGPAQLAAVVPKVKEKKVLPVEVEKEGPRVAGPAVLAPLPARIYVAVGVNRKGQKGAISGRQPVLLMAPPSAPPAAEVTYDENAFSITWTPPDDAFPPMATPGTEVLRSTPIGTRAISGAFNVYEVPAPAPAPPGSPAAPTPPAAGGRMPTPLNAQPVSVPPYVDKRMEFGKPRCYMVRAVTVTGGQSVESEASPPQCVTPVDTFPPAPPISLQAVGSEGSISLIWEANKEADLSGYIVLRATLPGGEFVQITRESIKETTFNDTNVKSGVRYAYVVVAIDVSKNRSVRSNQVEESAR